MKHRNAGRSVAALLCASILAVPAHAADLPADAGSALAPGQRLRVTAAAPGRFTGVTVGNLVTIGPDSLTLLDAERNATMDLPLGSITRVEVSRRRRHTKQGLLIGAGLGALGAAVILSSREKACGTMGEPRECTSGEKVGFSAFILGSWTGFGGWLGHRKQSDDWSDAPLDRLKVTVRPTRGGGRVALTLAF